MHEQIPDLKNKSKDGIFTGLLKTLSSKFKNWNQAIKKVYGSNFRTACLDKKCWDKENSNGNGMCYVYNYKNGTNVCSSIDGGTVWPCPNKFCPEIDKVNGRPINVRV